MTHAEGSSGAPGRAQRAVREGETPRACARKGDARLHLVTAVLTSALLAIACAAPPASLKPVHGSSPEVAAELCARILRDPRAPDSDAALGDLLRAWTRARESERGAACGGKLVFDSGAAGSFSPTYFDALAPAKDFAVRKLPRHRRAGTGVAMVGLRRNRGREPIETHFPPEAITRAVTAIAEPADHGKVRVRLLDSLHHEDAPVAGQPQPLAADFTVAFGALLARTGALSATGLGSFVKSRPSRTEQLYLMEPYDARKTPVVLVHGLTSTPLTWAALTNAIWGDPELRRRYQVWHYLYPTSAPFLHSARSLRNRIDEVRSLLARAGGGEVPDMVVVGHSMGGLLAKTLITDSGEAIWDAAFTRAPGHLRGEAQDVAAVSETLHWEARRYVRRVIFVATPHRGSELSRSVLGRIGDALAGVPHEFAARYARIDAQNPGAIAPAFQRALSRGELTSVDTLSPEHPLLPILDALPFAPWVSAHSIIGRRAPSRPLAESSDGIVSYRSSHIDDVVSEAVVHAGHSLLDHPEAIAEILRVLRNE